MPRDVLLFYVRGTRLRIGSNRDNDWADTCRGNYDLYLTHLGRLTDLTHETPLTDGSDLANLTGLSHLHALAHLVHLARLTDLTDLTSLIDIVRVVVDDDRFADNEGGPGHVSGRHQTGQLHVQVSQVLETSMSLSFELVDLFLHLHADFRIPSIHGVRFLLWHPLTGDLVFPGHVDLATPAGVFGFDEGIGVIVAPFDVGYQAGAKAYGDLAPVAIRSLGVELGAPPGDASLVTVDVLVKYIVCGYQLNGAFGRLHVEPV